MAGGAGVRGSYVPSHRWRFLFVGACALIFVAAVACVSQLTSKGQAQTPKRTLTLTHTSLPPASAIGAFGLDLMRAQPSGNLVLSPYSVATALAMTGTGAAGQTATQMAQTLHLAKPSAFDAVGSLQRAIAAEQTEAAQGHPKAPTLTLANGLFLQRGFPVKPAFTSGLQRHFDATPETVDFLGDPTGALNTINSWASDRTEGLIPELLPSLPGDTRLTLTNAIYLKADWLHRFAPANTDRARFHSRAGTTPTEFMHTTEQLRYGSHQSYAAVELPYRASTLSLLVVLPKEGEIDAFQRHLDAKGLAQIAHGLSPRSVRLSLPRFHLATQASLNSILEALGMTAAFGESAEFPRITTRESLKIDLLEHAADFSVDEAGTTAAAATALVVDARSAPRSTVEFNANHPFLFFLRDRQTGAVLFAGRLSNPTSATS